MDLVQSALNKILAHEYDPIKAREYYLRTRELKGRPAGSEDGTPNQTRPSRDLTEGPNKVPSKKPPVTKPGSFDEQVEALKTRLQALRKVLAELVAQAKARSGVETPEAKPTTQTKPETKPTTNKPQTPEEAAAAKKYYEEHKDEIQAQQLKELGTKIQAIGEKIKQMRAELNTPAKKKPERRPPTSRSQP